MRLLVVGAGGHAKVVVDAAQAAGFEVVAAIGDDGGCTDVLGVPVSPSPSGIETDGFIVAVGDNAARARLFAEYIEAGFTPLSVIHPAAVIAQDARIGAGTLVTAGAVVSVSAQIGANVIVNHGATVDHDCIVGDHTLLGPTTSMCGCSSVGDGVVLGAGACVIPQRAVGDWTVVGAGAVVAEDLPARSVCAGVPARVLREVQP